MAISVVVASSVAELFIAAVVAVPRVAARLKALVGQEIVMPAVAEKLKVFVLGSSDADTAKAISMKAVPATGILVVSLLSLCAKGSSTWLASTLIGISVVVY